MAACEPPAASSSLPRVLAGGDALLLVVGGVIGSGIFLVPSTVAAQTGSFALAISVWVLGGVLSLFGALTMAELAAMLPRAGGPYVYLRAAYGPGCSFLWGWACLLVLRSGGCAALAVAFALSLEQVVAIPEWGAKLVAILVVLGLGLVNALGTRRGAAIQNVTTLIKAGAVAAVAALPFAMGRAEPAHWGSHAPPQGDLLPGYAAALIAVLWAYSGWDRVAPVAEEVDKAQRSVPRALIGGTLIVIALYLAANFAYHSVLTVGELARTEHAAAAVLERLWGPIGRSLLGALVMCSTFGGVNSSLLVVPRILFAMGRDGSFLPVLGRVHLRYRTPAVAIAVMTIWTVVLMTAAGLFQSTQQLSRLFSELTSFVVFGGAVFEGLAVAAVFVLRRTLPEAPRPYRTWGYPWVPLGFLAVYAWLMVTTLVNRPWQSLLGLGLIGSGIPVHAWLHRKRTSLAAASAEPAPRA